VDHLAFVTLISFTAKTLARQSRNQNRNKHYHHEGREEHEVKKLKCNNFPILRVLRELRGAYFFTGNPEQLLFQT
jgi:hypothetical protein